MFHKTDRLMRLLVVHPPLLVLLAMSIALASFSPRCSFAADKPSQSPTSDAAASKKTVVERPPFDLTYVPPDAAGVVAIRPSAIFADPAMKPLACMANESPLLGMILLPFIPFADLKLPIQEIEQIILHTQIMPDSKHPSKDAENHSAMVTVMIRAAHDFDWLKMLRQIDPQTKEERCGDRVYYRSHLKPGKGEIWSELGTLSSKATFAYSIPDKRTLVLLPLPSTLRAFRTAEKTQRPHFSWDKDWKYVEHDLFAIARDNRQVHGATKEQLGDDHSPEWTALAEKTATMVAGVDWKDGIALHAYLSYKDSIVAEGTIQDLTTILKQARCDLVQNAPGDLPEPERRAAVFQVELWKSLIDGAHIKRRESTVCIHSQAKMTVAGMAKGLMSQFGGLFSTPLKMAPAPKLGKENSDGSSNR